jgi:hypothetical protein
MIIKIQEQVVENIVVINPQTVHCNFEATVVINAVWAEVSWVLNQMDDCSITYKTYSAFKLFAVELTDE